MGGGGLVTRGHCNKAPCTGELKATEIYAVTLLGARSLKATWREGHAVGNSVPRLSSSRWLSSLWTHHPNPCLCGHVAALCVDTSPLPLCPSLIRTPVDGSRAHPKPHLEIRDLITSVRTPFPDSTGSGGWDLDISQGSPRSTHYDGRAQNEQRTCGGRDSIAVALGGGSRGPALVTSGGRQGGFSEERAFEPRRVSRDGEDCGRWRQGWRGDGVCRAGR